MDKGMKKVVNLVTNYMSALCETGRVPGRVHRNIDNMNERTEYERAKVLTNYKPI